MGTVLLLYEIVMQSNIQLEDYVEIIGIKYFIIIINFLF